MSHLTTSSSRSTRTASFFVSRHSLRFVQSLKKNQSKSTSGGRKRPPLHLERMRMLLHTHTVPDEPDHWFLHLSTEEAQLLVEGLSLTLEQSPDAGSYTVNLGPVA